MAGEAIAYPIDRRAAWRAAAFHGALAAVFLMAGVAGVSILGTGAGASMPLRNALAVVGAVGFAAFGWLASAFLRRLALDAPYVIVAPEGMVDNASGLLGGAGWVPWSDVADIRVGTYHGLPCVDVVPTDRERFLARFSYLERWNRSGRLGYPALAIRGPLLPVAPDVLAEQMRAYWSASRGAGERGGDASTPTRQA